MLATLLNPWARLGTPLTALLTVSLSVGVAIVLGTIESLIARLKLRAVPQYIGVALAVSAIALLATTWRIGGPG